MDFKNEFDDLLNKLNNVKDEELENITNIDLDLLKSDYIEFYDLRKLLNEPKYHIDKFKILFLDFMNLNDYFYKTFSSNELINEEENENKDSNNMNNKKQNENKNEVQNKQINISEKKLININNIHSIDGIQEKLLNAKEEIINRNNRSLNKENKIKSNNEIIDGIPNNRINISKENIINQSLSNAKNNQINLSGENNINIRSRSMNESGNKSISFNINNSKSSFLKSKDDSSELSLNKYELLKNESTLHLALTDIKKYIQKDKINQLKFQFIKKELGLDEYEKMPGTSYEELARISFKIMLMMITQNNIYFENPKKVKLYDLINFYISNSKKNNNGQKESNSENKNIIDINNLKIQTNIHNIILTNLIDNQMEIDIVIEIETNVIFKLAKLFPKNIFFVDEIFKNKEEKKEEKKEENKEETNSEKITLVAEIARNIIAQGTEKLKQAVKYVEFISILNLYKDNMSVVINSEVLNSIFNYCKMSETTEKVFCLITNGDYPILKFVLNDILIEIFKDNNKITNIKEYINNKIIDNPKIHQRIEEKGIKSVEEKIYDIYLMFDTLKQNKIKFFVLYIGDIYQNFYEQNLLCNIFFNKNQKENLEIEKMFSSFKDKYKLKDIKTKTKDLKKIISEFNQQIDSITEKQFSLSKKVLESSIQIILDSFNTNKNKINIFNNKNYNKIGDKIKLDLVFNFLGEEDKSKNEKYKNLEKDFNFISSINSSFFNKKEVDFLISFNNDLAKFIEPTTFKIYVIDNIKNNEIYNNLMSFKLAANQMKKSESYNVRYICYCIDNGKYIIDSNKSNFQNIFDKTFININKYIFEEIDNFKKKLNTQIKTMKF